MQLLNILLQAQPGGSSSTLIIIIVIISIWFLIRELICWYYKINERVKLQKETNELLEKLLSKIENKNIS